MMTAIKSHWLTAVALLGVAFLVLLSVASLAADDPEYGTEDRIAGIAAALGALALLGGLWALRVNRFKLWVAYVLIVVGLVVLASYFWMFLIPTILALVLLIAGVIRGGLERELRPS